MEITKHQKIINHYKTCGWEAKGFKKKAKKRLSLTPWDEVKFYTYWDNTHRRLCGAEQLKESIESIEDKDYEPEFVELMNKRWNIVPDLWRFKIEKWNGYVLVLEIIEVVVTNKLSEYKLKVYSDMWLAFDSTDKCHFRLFVCDEYMNTAVLMDTAPIYIGKHKLELINH